MHYHPSSGVGGEHGQKARGERLTQDGWDGRTKVDKGRFASAINGWPRTGSLGTVEVRGRGRSFRGVGEVKEIW